MTPKEKAIFHLRKVWGYGYDEPLEQEIIEAIDIALEAQKVEYGVR